MSPEVVLRVSLRSVSGDVWDSELEDVASRLDDIAEQLMDLGISVLRAALEDGEGPGRPEVERRIAKARRSVERAAALLRDGPSSTMI